MLEKESSNFNETFEKIRTGTILENRYEIISELGKGSFGTVYKVFDRKLSIEKALKIFPKLESNADITNEVIQEARIVAKLNHPNIVKIYDFHETDHLIFIDMELVEGESLQRKIISNSIDTAKIVSFAFDIADALDYAHKNGIIHRDVKPTNIMIDKEGKAKLTDFGISSEIGKIILRKPQERGSTAYMSPQKLKGEDNGILDDIFAFGITLYQMKYARYPFNIEFKKPIFEIPKFLLYSDNKLDKIILKSMSLDKENRFQSFEELKKELVTKDKTDLKIYSPPLLSSQIVTPTQELKKNNWLSIILIAILIFITLPLYYVLLYKIITSKPKKVLISSNDYNYYSHHNGLMKDGQNVLYENDFINFLDENGTIFFSYKYKGEDKLDFDFIGNKYYLNGELVGMKITSPDDFPLPKNLEFIVSEIPLRKQDLIRQNNPNMIIILKDTMIPLSNNNSFSTMIINNDTNLDSLKMDFKLVENIIVDGRVNNISEFLFKFPNLKSISFNNVNYNSLNLKKNPLIENVYLHDSLLKKVEVHPFSNLKNIFTNAKGKIIVVGKDNSDVKIKRSDIITKKDNLWLKVFFVLINLLIILLAFLLMRALMKNKKSVMKTNNDSYSNVESNINTSEKNNEDDQSNNNISEFKTALEQNNFFYDEGSAFVRLKELQKGVSHKNYKKLQNELIENILRKVEENSQEKMIEPNFILLKSAKENLKSRKIKKAYKSILKKMRHISPIKFIKINGGEFEMGDFTGKIQAIARPLHRVKLNDFFMSETLVTNKQFCEFMNQLNHAVFSKIIKLNSPYCKIERIKTKFYPIEGYESFPVFGVSWFGAMEFCRSLGGRLPTEAEWEFACRNRGEKILFSQGNEITKENANFLKDKSDTSWHSVVSVKSFPPNKLGLYEMSGNLLEWCYDFYSETYYGISPLKNPKGPKEGSSHCVRGGAWCFPMKNAISFYRGHAKSGTQNNYLGFRVVKEK